MRTFKIYFLECFECFVASVVPNSVRRYGLYIAHQAPLSVGFSRQEDWSGLPCPAPGDPPNPRIKPTLLMSPALASRFFTTRATWEAHLKVCFLSNFKIYNTMLVTIVTMLYITPPGFVYFITEILCLLSFTHCGILPLPIPSNY